MSKKEKIKSLKKEVKRLKATVKKLKLAGGLPKKHKDGSSATASPSAAAKTERPPVSAKEAKPAAAPNRFVS